MADQGTEERRRRAAARRSLPGKIVVAGDAKPALYTHLSREERFQHMTKLCAAQWLLSGGELRKIPRSELPGEIFECRRG